MEVSNVCPIDLFDKFAAATSFAEIVGRFNGLCTALDIDTSTPTGFYQRIKQALPQWKAEKLWALLDGRAGQREYKGQQAARNMTVLVIGAGPVGLRTAIECALLGARVVLVEKRRDFSRNNVLHLWPFVIADLKALGAKLFYPRFCAGSLDHISIRQLQCVLLKVALVLGVQVHPGVGFEELILPVTNPNNDEVVGWRADLSPPEHYLSNLEFNCVIAADGKRNSLPGFPRREMRGKLAIGITANFINRRTQAEERVPEISGVSFIFAQQFFTDMKEKTGIDLENIVYYKDDTHYFVMCAKKACLLEKGVLRQDTEDTTALLATANVDAKQLVAFARQAADCATEGLLPDLEYSVNGAGQPDVAMFDFTSLFSAEVSCRILDRNGRQLLMGIVGDSLHEPFWPTGSGVARGFLGAFDMCWLLHGVANRIIDNGRSHNVLELLAERESVYRKLAQSRPETLLTNFSKYTLDPRTRYPSMDNSIRPDSMYHLIDTDNPAGLDDWLKPRRLVGGSAADAPPPQLLPPTLHQRFFVQQHNVLSFFQHLLSPYNLEIINFGSSWQNGLALCAIADRFSPPELVNYGSLSPDNGPENRALAFEKIKELFGVGPPTDDVDWLLDGCIDHTDGLMVTFEYLAVLAKLCRQLVQERMGALRTRAGGSGSAAATSHRRQPHRPQHQYNGQQAPAASAGLNAEFLAKIQAREQKERVNEDELLDDVLDELDELDECQVNEILDEWGDEEARAERNRQYLAQRAANPLRGNADHKRVRKMIATPSHHRLAGSRAGDMLLAGRSCRSKAAAPQAVDKLDDSRLTAIESMVTGQLEREEQLEAYQRKHRDAAARAKRIDEKEVKEMETKLENTVMGSLMFVDKDKREKLRVMSNQDEQIIKAKMRDMLDLANGGFEPSIKNEYKEFDKKLSQLDKVLHEPELHKRGLTGVSSLIGQHAQKAGLAPSRSAINNRNKPPPPPPKKASPAAPAKPFVIPVSQVQVPSVAPSQPKCWMCEKNVYLTERMLIENHPLHKRCFRCSYCQQPLRMGHYVVDRDLKEFGVRLFCSAHANLPATTKLARLSQSQTGSSNGKAQSQTSSSKTQSPTSTSKTQTPIASTTSVAGARRSSCSNAAEPEPVDSAPIEEPTQQSEPDDEDTSSGSSSCSLSDSEREQIEEALSASVHGSLNEHSALELLRCRRDSRQHAGVKSGASYSLTGRPPPGTSAEAPRKSSAHASNGISNGVGGGGGLLSALFGEGGYAAMRSTKRAASQPPVPPGAKDAMTGSQIDVSNSKHPTIRKYAEHSTPPSTSNRSSLAEAEPDAQAQHKQPDAQVQAQHKQQKGSDVQRVLSAAEKLRRQRNEQRMLMANQLTRRLDELQVKLDSQKTAGVRLESSLLDAPAEDTRVARWRYSVFEYESLVAERHEATLRLDIIKLEHEHSKLQAKLTALGEQQPEPDADPVVSDTMQTERGVLAEMLDVVTRRDALVTRLNAAKDEERQRQQQQLNALYPTVNAFFTQL